MTESLDELAFEADLKAVKASVEAARWEIEKGSGLLEVFVTLSSALNPEESFQARLAWSRYPGSLPGSLKFREPQTGRLDIATAWPVCRGFRPSSLDACVNWCAEGFALHPEWVNDPKWRWDTSGNPLLRMLSRLQFELDTFFDGRFK